MIVYSIMDFFLCTRHQDVSRARNSDSSLSLKGYRDGEMEPFGFSPRNTRAFRKTKHISGIEVSKILRNWKNFSVKEEERWREEGIDVGGINTVQKQSRSGWLNNRRPKRPHSGGTHTHISISSGKALHAKKG